MTARTSPRNPTMPTDREMLDAVRSMFASAACEADNITSGRRGMQVSYQHDFAGVLHLPSVARTVRWWERRLTEHLSATRDPEEPDEDP